MEEGPALSSQCISLVLQNIETEAEERNTEGGSGLDESAIEPN